MKSTTLFLSLCLIVGAICQELQPSVKTIQYRKQQSSITSSPRTRQRKGVSRRPRNRNLQSKGKGKGSSSSTTSVNSKKSKSRVSAGDGGGYDGGAATSSSQPFLILQAEHPGMCMGYLAGPDVAQPVRLVPCTETESDVTLWDKVDVTSNTYKLRHADSHLCLPQNPEFPSFPFDCFESLGGLEMASADSINGLVNCDSQNAAVLGTITGQSNGGEVMLGLTSCMEMGHHIIILMTYVDPEGSIIVLWGEEILLSLDDQDVANYNLVANFIVGTPTS